MNECPTKDAPQKTHFQPDSPWISSKTDAKPYIPELLDNIYLLHLQYMATSIINNGPYIDNMFALKNSLMLSTDN